MITEYDNAVKFMEQGKMKEALDALNLAIVSEPENPDYYSERGVVYFHLKNKMKSIADMNKAVDLQPDYSYRYSSRAYIKDWLGDLEGAIADYEIAIKLDPEDAIAYNNLGMLQEKLGYKKKANQYYDRADSISGVTQRQKQFNTEEIDIKLSRSESLSEEHQALKVQGIDKETFNETNNKNQTKGKVFKNVFSDKKTFKEFISFVKNGFKIPTKNQ